MLDTDVAPTSEPDVRLESVEGSGRRRSWSAEEKGRIVGETLSGRESLSAVARRHGVTAQQLYGWRRRAGKERPARAEELGFAAVLVSRSAIEIELCGMTIRVAPGIDEATLRTVLQALSRCRTKTAKSLWPAYSQAVATRRAKISVWRLGDHAASRWQ